MVHPWLAPIFVCFAHPHSTPLHLSNVVSGREADDRGARFLAGPPVFTATCKARDILPLLPRQLLSRWLVFDEDLGGEWRRESWGIKDFHCGGKKNPMVKGSR